MVQRLPISLCMFVKNEEKNLRDCIESVKPVIAEIVVVDTGSQDKTLEIAHQYTKRVYSVPFTDFGSVRTITAHLAAYPWVLMLDADERLDPDDWKLLPDLINQPAGVKGNNLELDADGNVIIDSWALPRKRWADAWMREQVEVEAYPDWQVRLFRNHPDKKITFRRRVHETISGAVQTKHSEAGPIIHHIQNLHKNEEDLSARRKLYKKLYEMDIAEGIEHIEPPVAEMDDA